MHPDYARWLAIKQRCTNVNNCNYQNYGAKGIQLSPAFDSFATFADYVSSLSNYGKPGFTLDRINGDGNYEAGNLRWASASTQNANQVTSGKGSNRYNGVNWSVTHKRWIARATYEGKTLLSKVCLNQETALAVRNQYITDNGLPHPIQQWNGE